MCRLAADSPIPRKGGESMRAIQWRNRLGRVSVTTLAAILSTGPLQPSMASNPGRPTSTPISHLIVIVGENHTFDNVFATYQPKSGQSIANLLSKGTVDAQGNPGPNFNQAAQNQRPIPPPIPSVPRRPDPT